MKQVPFFLLSLLTLIASCTSAKEPAHVNFLVIVADDLNWSSVGAFGNPMKDVTPHIDQLAAEGMRFNHAHVTVAVCQPSRGALATGRYPHKSGIEGFFHTEKNIPNLVPVLKENGYFCGILSKVEHSSPRSDTPWDFIADMEALGMGRDKERYRTEMKKIINQSRANGKPFYLMLNSNDPHRPFSGSDQEKKAWPDIHLAPPSKSYKPEEVSVPDFLPDLPEIRLELAEYYSSVKRLDDLVGVVLDVLDSEGLDENTMVMFLSDNGMAFPFSKTNCYLNSTKTPWIVRWPGHVPSGSVDEEHFISGIDFFPTILEAGNMPIPEGIDGISFLSVLEGNEQPGRSQVFTQFYETSAKKKYPMRCIQNKRYGYIYNFWADGENAFRNESQSGRTWSAMKVAGEERPDIKQRIQFFSYRTREELYDLEKDPDALNNLIGNPEYADMAAEMKGELIQWMEENEDPEVEKIR
ncbi:sulfatase family protein [Parapedobacter indicus]|uniref:N-sulfoglucosamine sulfohydrolase n=1 Tax=Parapedobacter indicus TaxID=1477437 RepID=A0A1I3KC22_9SPHI|nr:sulfatase [Parapedobacter indicus]PPL01776.1 N-sulfoglucosamine sulfohydrolase [Parapedobacter indicus]SFI70061.1 N-sulfoglucosamine sulfohydrolase [Parapedobacter indicus]